MSSTDFELVQHDQIRSNGPFTLTLHVAALRDALLSKRTRAREPMCKRRFPDSYRLVVIGTVEAGLRKCRLGRSSCLPVPASSVSDERGSMHGSSTACVTPTTSPTHSSASIGSGLRRECCSRWPCSCTRPLMELRRHT